MCRRSLAVCSTAPKPPSMENAAQPPRTMTLIATASILVLHFAGTEDIDTVFFPLLRFAVDSMASMSGKGLARCLSYCPARFQPLPIGTAREVFPQAARPEDFTERVMCPCGADGRFHLYASAFSSGRTFQSQNSPRTPERYSLLHRRQPTLRFRRRVLRVRRVLIFLSR